LSRAYLWLFFFVLSATHRIQLFGMPTS
jgi:hypothetical protein